MSFVSEATRHIKVADAMETRMATIGHDATIGEAADILLATSQESFPFVDDSGAFLGVMSRSDIVEAIKTGEPGARVAPFAHGEIATVDPAETLDKAMEKLGEASVVGVVGADGVFKGLITPQSLAEVMLIKAARPDWRFSRRGS